MRELANRRGRLRPTLCEHCGVAPPTEKHHEDYSQPLTVIWPCHNCHVERHRALGGKLSGRNSAPLVAN